MIRLVSFLALCLFGVLPASAHPLLQNKLWVLISPDTARVAVDVTVKELSVAQLLQPEADGSFDSDLLANAAEYHTEYVLRHLQVQAGGKTLDGKLTRLNAPAQYGLPEETRYQYELEYPLQGAAPDTVQISHGMLREFPYGPGQPWDVTYSIRWKQDQNAPVQTGLLRMGEAFSFKAQQPSGSSVTEAFSGSDAPVTIDIGRTFKEYLWHGVMHILTGYDHLLFVTALVLATVTFWEMVKVIAAFTLAHTLTLILSVFDLVRLPSWIVEPIIAASIVFVAVENIFFPRRSHSWVRLLVAFGFGLIHGLGFAGGLLEAMEGLPALGIWLAIIAFSIGVEIGHQVVVLPVFGILKLGRASMSPTLDARVLRFASILVSLGGAYFLVHAISAA